MSKLPAPIFLEYSSYRLRRRIDAIRLLPFLGLGVFLMPALMAQIGPGAATSGRLIYFFTCWLFLIALARYIARGLPRKARDPDGTGKD